MLFENLQKILYNIYVNKKERKNQGAKAKWK